VKTANSPENGSAGGQKRHDTRLSGLLTKAMRLPGPERAGVISQRYQPKLSAKENKGADSHAVTFSNDPCTGVAAAVMSEKDLETRLDELETRMAFQDDIINTLSEQVAKQELELRELWQAKQLLHRQLKEVSPSNIKSEEEETPPPHY